MSATCGVCPGRGGCGRWWHEDHVRYVARTATAERERLPPSATGAARLIYGVGGSDVTGGNVNVT